MVVVTLCENRELGKRYIVQNRFPMEHFTVVCLVTWPMNESEARVYLD